MRRLWCAIGILSVLGFLETVWSFETGSATPRGAKGEVSSSANAAEDEFIIKKPGEITFTTGIVIEGRVEKPQVMLVLTKERVKMEELNFEQSFVRNITEPLRYNTFEAYNAKDERTKSDEGQNRIRR